MDPFTIFMTIASMASSMMAARQQARAQKQAAQQQMNEEAKQKWKIYEAEEKKRQDGLKKALARKRARMGATGLSAADGSAGAIIQGLRTDAAEQTYDGYTTAKESLGNMQAGLTRNLLDASDARKRSIYQQAGQAVEGVTGINGLSSLTNFATSDTKNYGDLLQGGTALVDSLGSKFEEA